MAARRSDAQEHIDDRADRLRQDGDQPSSRKAGSGPVREGGSDQVHRGWLCRPRRGIDHPRRSEEHTSELQSLMRISYAVFCLKKKKKTKTTQITQEA